ncbi:hypothetical protein NliqN6_0737 [Naganishia liquefaciens]|uniref:Uncharacterized protein n=1 Tax=Naganishia liquefaciens TaxID=104408 RepID=A0A8H3TNI4_9TREE|nr:hypothetical protein NliqN6_0737 [Naganishia liquefaciens]
MLTSKSLVPAAAPVVVEALRAGPLTWKELWKHCTSPQVLNSVASGSEKAAALQRSFESKSKLKKRILPVLLAQGLIERHALTSPTKIVDVSERSQFLTSKLLRRQGQSDEASTSTSQPAFGSQKSNTEFVWSLPQALLGDAAHPSLRNPERAARLSEHLDALSTGRETVIELSQKVRALRGAERIAAEAARKYRIPALQTSWERPVGVVVSSANSVGAQWVTSCGEKRHLNKRRATARIAKERKMQSWWDALEQAKIAGREDARA